MITLFTATFIGLLQTAHSKNLDRLFSYIVFWAQVEKSVLVFKNNHKKVNNLVSLIRAHWPQFGSDNERG
jgi:hypothetical protein